MGSTNSKFHLNAKPVTSYIITAFIGLMYMLFYDTRLGLSFVAAMAAAPLISYLLIQSSARNISANISLSRKTAYKGETVDMKVTIINKGLFPVPFLCIEFFNELNLTCPDSNKFLTSLSGGETSVITQSYEAEIWGSAKIGIKNITVPDFFGLFEIEIVADNAAGIIYSDDIEICPAIYECQTNDLAAVSCSEVTFDDNEETQSDVKHSFLSIPGYEHRPYVPGDALKRINWKLSTKIDKYMVREYEPVGSNKQVILLDRFGLQSRGLSDKERKSAMLLEERTIEAVLAMLTLMHKQNVACTVYCFIENNWVEFVVEDQEDILNLQYVFSKYKFQNPSDMPEKQRIPIDVINEKKTNSLIMLFTCALDYQLCQELSDVNDKGMQANVVCPDKPKNTCENMWVVNEFYDFYSVQGGYYD